MTPPEETAVRSHHAALQDLIAMLEARGYRFTTPTPATHARVLARQPERTARSLTELLGWSLPFASGEVDAEVEAILARLGSIETSGAHLRSRLRASTLADTLYLHSAYPTIDHEAVFFGPDSYRFARLIRHELERMPCRAGGTIVDIGTGAGVGGITAARLTTEASTILTDINPLALELAHANATAAHVDVAIREGPILAGFAEPIDLAVANPPYILDEEGRAYRDGGDLLGASLSIDMAAAALPRLASRGRLILYTGSAIVNGQDRLAEALTALARNEDCALDYDEIDPDVFGEELERTAYRDVDRIAAVSAIFTRIA